MSTHDVPIVDGSVQGVAGLQDLVVANIRPPDSVALNGANVTYTFTPDLTTAEAALFDTLASLAKSRLDVSPADYATIRTNLQTLRDLRQMGRNAFMGLAAAERDRLMYDAQVATTMILLAILRD